MTASRTIHHFLFAALVIIAASGEIVAADAPRPHDELGPCLRVTPEQAAKRGGEVALRVSAEDLRKELESLLKAQFSMRMQKATQQLTNTSQLRKVRRDIARVRTVLESKA